MRDRLLKAMENLRVEIIMYCYTQKICTGCLFELQPLVCLKEILERMEDLLDE
jgi:hypothetical protein